MSNIEFKNKKPNYKKLIAYGFYTVDNNLVKEVPLMDSQLTLTVTISQDGALTARVTDTEFGDEYTLHLVESSFGAYVGKVREEYKSVLKEIEEKCYDSDYFEHSQSHMVINHIFEKHGNTPEFPFESDGVAVFRHGESKKWYGALMTVSASKMGYDSDEKMEIINLKIDPNELNRIVDNNKYFRAYHMNKRLWTTLILDGRLSDDEVKMRIDQSYTLVATKNKKNKS